MKNCEVALRSASVRAMPSVPRMWLNLLVASLRIGGWVGFSTSSGVNPPPWIMNPGIDPMEDGPAIETFVDVLQEVVDRDRRAILEQLHRDVAERGRDDGGGIAGRRGQRRGLWRGQRLWRRSEDRQQHEQRHTDRSYQPHAAFPDPPTAARDTIRLSLVQFKWMDRLWQL